MKCTHYMIVNMSSRSDQLYCRRTNLLCPAYRMLVDEHIFGALLNGYIPRTRPSLKAEGARSHKNLTPQFIKSSLMNFLFI
jgi:hypothetical protein